MDIILRGRDIPADLREFFEPAGVGMKDVIEWRPAPFSGSHFAVFPEAIPEKLIRAATSERGCCAACGAPWVRAVETVKSWREDAYDDGGKQTYGPGSGNQMVRPSNGGMSKSEYATTGWQPSCTCREGKAELTQLLADRGMGAQDLPDLDTPVPCTVLDPFSGSGTTCKVAVSLGRRAIGVDICSEYLDEVTSLRFGEGVQMELVSA